MKLICSKTVHECGPKALDNVKLIVTDFEPRFASELAENINKFKSRGIKKAELGFCDSHWARMAQRCSDENGGKPFYEINTMDFAQ